MSVLLYLDNCCYNRPFDDQNQIKIRIEAEAKLFIQEQIRARKIELVWSYVLDYENGRNPYQQRRDAIGLWRGLAACDIIESPAVLEKAQYCIDAGLGVFDALHIACAVTAHAEVFLTCDRGILRKRATLRLPIRIESPVEFIEQGEET